MLDKRKDIDLLIGEFWKKGYLTLSRKFGTYLPEPTNIGGFAVDIIAKQKNNYAIGITLTEEDFTEAELIKRITFLATRQTKSGHRKVQLFIGANKQNYSRARMLLKQIDPEIRKNIKLFLIEEEVILPIRKKEKIFIS